jgi:uncharacterized damage-inducible protein DinB
VESQNIVELIERVMTGDPWHGPSVRRVLEGVTFDVAARRPPGNAHSIWELVVHMTGWTREVTKRLRGRDAQEPDAGDWPEIGEPTADRWRAAQQMLFAAHEELATVIRGVSADRLSQPVRDFRDNALGTGLSHYLTLHGIVHHTVYHAGQIAMLQRILAENRG